jgi:hypothetical protein
MWIPQAPGHVGIGSREESREERKVNYFVAKRACERQGARLPHLEELEDGIADGEFFEGLNLDTQSRYFIDSESNKIIANYRCIRDFK